MRPLLAIALVLSAASARAETTALSPAGSTGLLRVDSAETLPEGRLAVLLAGGLFADSHFLIPHTANRTLSGDVAVGLGLFPGMELVWRGSATQSTWSGSGGALSASSVGDQRLTLKMAHALGGFRVGALVALEAPSPPDGQSWFSGLGADLRLLGGRDFALTPSVSLRVHALLGYRVDRSGTFLPGDASRFETYALGLSRYDQLEAAVGVEAPVRWCSIFAEGVLEQPVHGPSGAPSATPLGWLTIGARAFLGTHFSVLAGAEVNLNRFGPIAGIPVPAPYTLRISFEMSLGVFRRTPAANPPPPRVTPAPVVAAKPPPAPVIAPTPPAPRPVDLSARLEKARALRGAGDWYRAACELDAVLQLQPSSGLLYETAQAYANAGEQFRAIELYSRYLAQPSPEHEGEARAALKSVESGVVPGTGDRPPVIRHTPITDWPAEIPVKIQASIQDINDLLHVSLSYRAAGGQEGYRETEMTCVEGVCSATLPAGLHGAVDYFISAVDNTGKEARSGTESWPYTIHIVDQSDRSGH